MILSFPPWHCSDSLRIQLKEHKSNCECAVQVWLPFLSLPFHLSKAHTIYLFFLLTLILSLFLSLSLSLPLSFSLFPSSFPFPAHIHSLAACHASSSFLLAVYSLSGTSSNLSLSLSVIPFSPYTCEMIPLTFQISPCTKPSTTLPTSLSEKKETKGGRGCTNLFFLLYLLFCWKQGSMNDYFKIINLSNFNWGYCGSCILIRLSDPFWSIVFN